MSKLWQQIVITFFVTAVVIVGLFLFKISKARKDFSNTSEMSKTLDFERQKITDRIYADDQKFEKDAAYVKISIQVGPLNQPAYYKIPDAKKAYTDFLKLKSLFEGIRQSAELESAACIEKISQLATEKKTENHKILKENVLAEEDYDQKNFFVQKVVALAAIRSNEILSNPQGFCESKEMNFKKLDRFVADLEKAFSKVNVALFR